MSDEIDELTRVQVVIDDLSSPTDREFVYATDQFSERAIAGAAAKIAMEGGGGPGELPDWWTVDSTPGSENITFNGQVFVKSNDPEVGTGLMQLQDADGNPVIIFDNDGGGHFSEGHILISQYGQFTVDVNALLPDGNAIYELKKGGTQVFAVRPGGGVSSLFGAYAPGDVAVLISATTGQTANLLEVYDEDFNLVHAVTANGGVIFPSADPHVVGAWWDNAGTLTRSAG